MKCPFCKELVNEGASVCKSCGATREPYRRTRWGVVAIGWAFIVGGCLWGMSLSNLQGRNPGPFVEPWVPAAIGVLVGIGLMLCVFR